MDEDEDVPVHPATLALRLPTLPAEFWSAREVHERIRQAAHSRLASADLVLHVALARLAAMSSWELGFDSGRGISSLNYFTAAVGPSGAGKSTGTEAAVDMVATPDYLEAADLSEPEPFADGLPIGSGEGIAEAFMGTKEIEIGVSRKGDPITKNVRAQVRHNAFVVIDEGETFSKMGERKGATVGATLRSAWSGATLGQANGTAETTRRIPARSYSLGLVVGFQPATALPLLADTATGMQQRFTWVSAVDPSIPDEPVEHPGPIKLPALPAPRRPGGFGEEPTPPMTFPAEVIAELRADRLAKVRGTLVVPEADSQAPLMRCKIAALLALLDGRVDVDLDDWNLSGTVWSTSCAVRDAVTGHARAVKAAQEELVTQFRVQLAERQAAATAAIPAKVDRLASNLAGHVVREGMLLRSAARKTMRSSDRHLFDQVVEKAAELGLLRVADGGGALLPPVVPEGST
ncbi:hypothetical protein ACQEVB_11655 [Pseudonocardia sp. CA-107938]|uniref:hypothetical protein n=1 Tax=Pseudonocardia sp. CA-107938 TaxID=3240021 RepID=UPI003D8D2117